MTKIFIPTYIKLLSYLLKNNSSLSNIYKNTDISYNSIIKYTNLFQEKNLIKKIKVGRTVTIEFTTKGKYFAVLCNELITATEKLILK